MELDTKICSYQIYKRIRVSIFIIDELIKSWSYRNHTVEKYRNYTVYTDGWVTYNNETCNVLGLKHYLHQQLKNSLMDQDAVFQW